MGLERKILFERLEIDKNDHVSVLLKKAVVDDDVLVAEAFHRVLIPVDADADSCLDVVQTALAAEGYKEIPAAVRQRVVQAKAFTKTLPTVDKPKRKPTK